MTAAAAVCAPNKSIPQASFARASIHPCACAGRKAGLYKVQASMAQNAFRPQAMPGPMATLDIYSLACHARLDKWPKNWRRKNNVKCGAFLLLHQLGKYPTLLCYFVDSENIS